MGRRRKGRSGIKDVPDHMSCGSCGSRARVATRPLKPTFSSHSRFFFVVATSCSNESAGMVAQFNHREEAMGPGPLELLVRDARDQHRQRLQRHNLALRRPG